MMTPFIGKSWPHAISLKKLSRSFDKMMDVLTPADDYPLHQSSRPFRDPGTDRNLYDRFFFCGYPTSGDSVGDTYFAMAFGQYVGRNICDGAFSVIHQGVQYSVRGSRLLGADRLDLQVGPVSIELIEPMRIVRVRIDDDMIRGELTFTARGPAFEEPHYRWAPGNLTVFDITRMTQNGTWSGELFVNGERIAIDDSWMGTRDRSWGIRPVGQSEPNMAPDGPPLTFYWLWAPLTFPDANVLFDVNEHRTGDRWHENAMIASVNVDEQPKLGVHIYDMAWQEGSRWAEGFEMSMQFPDQKVGIHLQPLTTFYMQGIGYTHPTWGHGYFVGPNERTRDSRVLSEVDPADLANHHVQHICRATRDDGVIGYGLLEILARGAHEPSGFTGYTDLFEQR
jgi:hypothetical protein